ncbi:olfactory receptor 6N1-like [Bombina bombina]|uniref:olfactory receptor 6N1-like n=1 Tax=Bombina bombina TaxID=8345 RepID=UPI00235AB6A2|nr:olfactory receptor 6N1-like [Bombina bombina]
MVQPVGVVEFSSSQVRRGMPGAGTAAEKVDGMEMVKRGSGPSSAVAEAKKDKRGKVIESTQDNEEHNVVFEDTNHSTHFVTEFIIFGFPSLQKFPILLFCIFIIIYLITITGNAIIIILVLLDQHLQTPMYFLVSNLSFIDLCYTTVTVPKMLAKFSMKLDTISYSGCFLQMYFFISLAAAECLLLPVMAFDRYIAICVPLHYHTIMTKKLYVLLSSAAWIGGFAAPVTVLILALKLPFCGPNVINHYYCDHPPLLQLACVDTSLNVAVGSSFSATVLVISFSLVVMSYIKIISTILKISSHEGRKKTFSTCASHFVVVNLFFLPLIFMYIRPTATYSSDVDSLVSMLYTVLTPMMNPIIYSLRNRDIKTAFKKRLKRVFVITLTVAAQGENPCQWRLARCLILNVMELAGNGLFPQYSEVSSEQGASFKN